jgi:hypothetical protein
MKRYSKPIYQGSRLRGVVERAEKSANTPVREAVPLPQTQRVGRRMSVDTIAEMVQTYRNGASTTHLRQRFDLSQGGVTRILHAHGVETRGQGLADSDLPTAAEFYRGGMTLAQLGERFGVSPNAVRRALLAATMVVRPRGGSRPQS